MKLICLILSSFFILGNAHAFFNPITELDGVQYDCSDIKYDNDAKAFACLNYQGDISFDSLLQNSGSRRVFKSYEEVLENLSPYIESQYDMFFIVNTARVARGVRGIVKPQHMLVVEKGPGETFAFKRNSSGLVNGMKKSTRTIKNILGQKMPTKYQAGRPTGNLIPVSTGAGRHMKSFSGIYQFNSNRSISINKSSGRRRWRAPMSNAMYLGYIYTDSRSERSRSRTNNPRVSYAAIHGTPSFNWKKLGKQRDSHGCVRIHPWLAEKLFPYTMNKSSKKLPKLNWLYSLPHEEIQNYGWAVGDSESHIEKKKAKSALIILFNGYEAPMEISI